MSMSSPDPGQKRLLILHCLRAAQGGLFRHVRDLARHQAARGHAVGLVCDASPGDPLSEERLKALEPILTIGIHRVPMTRGLGWRDLTAAEATRQLAQALDVDVLHGHGAKGGVCARLAAARLATIHAPSRTARPPLRCYYTPHGGSLHFAGARLEGRAYALAERVLARATDGVIFESRFARETYFSAFGRPACATTVIPNGLEEAELTAVIHDPQTADVLFVGELRGLKGVDVLLKAIAAIREPWPPTALIVGDGPDAQQLRDEAARLGLLARVRFAPSMPARRAFARGRCLAVPSRAESLPYVVLEAAGCGLPVVASNVGGIPEIVAGSDTGLVPPDDPAALALAISALMRDPRGAAERALRLREVVANRFQVAQMGEAVLDFYAGRAA